MRLTVALTCSFMNAHTVVHLATNTQYQMGINPPLKVVPNKWTLSSRFSNTC